jgi:hypothetical protein
LAGGSTGGCRRAWYTAIYPLGYPWLLNLGLALGLDTLRVAQALSALSGALALVAVAALAGR